VLAALEEAHAAALFGSGMAAATTIVLALPAPAHIVHAGDVLGVPALARHEAPRFGTAWIRRQLGSRRDVGGRSSRDRTKLVYLETPAIRCGTITTSPRSPKWRTQRVPCWRSIRRLPRRFSPVPLRLGADLVMHSASKYLQRPFRRHRRRRLRPPGPARLERSRRCARNSAPSLGHSRLGCCCAALRTLDVGSRRRPQPRCLIATRLARHAQVAQVLYPGLSGHPGHAVGARQMTGGFGAMLSIRIVGGNGPPSRSPPG